MTSWPQTGLANSVWLKWMRLFLILHWQPRPVLSCGRKVAKLKAGCGQFPNGNRQAVKGTQSLQGHGDFSYHSGTKLVLWLHEGWGSEAEEGVKGEGLMVIKALFCTRFPAKHFCKQTCSRQLWVRCSISSPHYRDEETEARSGITTKAEQGGNSGLSSSAQGKSPGPKLKNELLMDLGQILRF